MAGEIGRPCLLDEQMLEKTKYYLTEGFQEIGNVVPSVAGLCCFLGVSKKAVYNWSADTIDNNNNPIRKEFIHTLEAIQAKQEMMLMDGGLSQKFSAPITKLMLANHGYSDSVKQDITTNGESVNKPTVINLVAPKNDSN